MLEKRAITIGTEPFFGGCMEAFLFFVAARPILPLHHTALHFLPTQPTSKRKPFVDHNTFFMFF